MSGLGLNGSSAANEGPDAGDGPGGSGGGFILWGRFIDDEQVEELRLLGRAIGCVGDLLAIGDDPVERGAVEALFKVFEERLEGIMGSEMPVTQFAYGADGRY